MAAAVERGLPVLGICRGMQALNVSRGGTLHQHLPDRSTLEHNQGHASFEPAHAVSVAIGSLPHRLTRLHDARGQLVPPPGRRSARPGPGDLRRGVRHRRHAARPAPALALAA